MTVAFLNLLDDVVKIVLLRLFVRGLFFAFEINWRFIFDFGRWWFFALSDRGLFFVDVWRWRWR